MLKNAARNAMSFTLCAFLCSFAATDSWAEGAVYAMTNALGNNQIKVYSRATDGSLTLAQTVATGGGGSGLQLAGVDSLGSAGSLQLDTAHKFLFAVNTESAAENNGAGAYNTDCQQGTITSFAVASDGSLTFADRVFSGGLFPNSLTVTTIQVPQTSTNGNGKGNGKGNGNSGKTPPETRELVYVLNAGGPEPPATCNLTPGTANTPNITGFQVDEEGHLIPLNSTEPVSPGPASASNGVACTAAAASGFSALTGAPAADFQCGLNPPSTFRSPGQIRFTPDSSRLIVSVKGTNSIYVFPVDVNGLAGNPAVSQVIGPALPSFLAMAFDRLGNLIVVEPFGSAAAIPAGGQGAVSSFAFGVDGTLNSISAHVADGGTAASMIAIEPVGGSYAYVSNNLSASISSYTIGSNGALTLLNGAAASGSGPNDLATAVEGTVGFLYVVEAGSGTVGAFRINGDGSLTEVSGGSGLPAGRSAQGLAAY